MSETSYLIEEAKSARAACKKCKEKIAKGELRIGVCSPGPNDIVMTRWFHMECFTIPKKLAKDGVDARKFVQEILEDQTNDNNLTDMEDKVIEAIETKPVSSKAGDGSEAAGGSAKERIQKIKAAWEKMNNGDNSEPEEPPKKKAKKTKGKVKSEGTSEEGLKNKDIVIAQAFGFYANYKNDELKDILRWNKQAVSGSKDVLIQRILDGHVNGRLDRCPSCGEGRLKLQDEDGETVSCSGWFDKENMVRHSCFYSCPRGDAPRILPWYTEEPPEEEEEKEDKVEKDSPTAHLQSIASKLTLNLSNTAGIKSAAKELARICTEDEKHQIDFPDKSKARMEIGKVLLTNKDKSVSEIVKILVDRFGFQKEKEKSKQKRDDTLASLCKEPKNGEIVSQFQELSNLYFKEGNKNAGLSYKKACAAIQNIEFEITQENALGLGKGKTKVAGIGKGSAEKIHEFLSTGKIEKLEEKRACA